MKITKEIIKKNFKLSKEKDTVIPTSKKDIFTCELSKVYIICFNCPFYKKRNNRVGTEKDCLLFNSNYKVHSNSAYNQFLKRFPNLILEEDNHD